MRIISVFKTSSIVVKNEIIIRTRGKKGNFTKESTEVKHGTYGIA